MAERLHIAILVLTAVFASSCETLSEDQQEIPELAGAEPAIGTQAIDGSLPNPWLDYSVTVSASTQRISMYEGGLVVLTIEQGDRRTQKRVRIPPDALEAYSEYLTPAALRSLPDQSGLMTTTSDREVIRIYDSNGGYAERAFDPNLAVPSELERMRFLLQDFVRVLGDDRGVTNPLLGYEPQVGDELISSDLRTWRVLQLQQNGEMIELQCEGEPIRSWVHANDLEVRFVGWRRPHPLDEE